MEKNANILFCFVSFSLNSRDRLDKCSLAADMAAFARCLAADLAADLAKFAIAPQLGLASRSDASYMSDESSSTRLLSRDCSSSSAARKQEIRKRTVVLS